MSEAKAKVEFKTASSIIYILLFLLGLWGCLVIYNATFFKETPFYFVGRQFIWLMIGMFFLYASSHIPFDFYRDLVWPLAIATYIPLIAVLFLGVRVNGMCGWFSSGGVFIQPSEFAKAPYLLLLCYLNSRIENDLKRCAAMALAAFVWIVPIALEPDIGSVMIYLAGFFLVYWLGGGKIKYIIVSFIAAIPVCAFFVYKNQYILDRITGFWNPGGDPLGSGWHIMQFRFALSRGGFWGASLGKAIWANAYLPLSHSDSAFAAMAESVGFAGACPVILGAFIIALAAYFLARKKSDCFVRNIIMSLGGLFVVQALIHISVNVTLLPPTGITLPLISYGGSSLVSCMIAFGILLSAARSPETVKEETE
jgi:cell division protein FtsW